MRIKTQYFLRNLFAYLLIGLFAYWIIPVPSAQAAGEFQADYDVGYAIAPNGKTIVTQNVTLTNKQTNLYPKQYAITIDTDKIHNVIARDNAGGITPTITQHDGKTEILLTFNEQIVGIGKQLLFTLRFENSDIAKQNGSIWEINIPGVDDDADLSSYFVSLQVPVTFGPNAYTSPLPADGKRWNKEQMIRGGISAAYGNEQIYTVKLSYFLQNSNVTPGVATIALPPDTAYQTVSILSLEPAPVTVDRDPDGNWLARYRLAPGQKMPIEAKLAIRMFLYPKEKSVRQTDYTDLYTKPLPFWETDADDIQALAKKYPTPRAIYNYVVQTLGYDESRVSQNPIRKGAKLSLTSPKQSVCMEFTDLFIAIARAAGIPARELVGFAYTTNTKLRPLSLVTDVLHAWPEYYDAEKKSWIPVDPTWENTTGGVNYFDKLDFNHIVFAIHGLSSSEPYPAGSYHEEGKIGKDVSVAFAMREPQQITNKLLTTIQFPTVVTAGFSSEGLVTIQNTSGNAVEHASILVQASPIAYSFSAIEPYLPPFAKKAYPIRLDPTSYITRGRGQITVTTDGEVHTAYFDIQPMYWVLVPVGILLSVICVGLWLFVVKSRSWTTRHIK